MAKEKTTCKFRFLIKSDIPKVLDISTRCFKNPWGKKDFLETLKTQNIIPLVYIEKEEIIGYLIHEIHKDCFRLLNLAIHPNYQRKKIGTFMISELKKKLTLSRCKIILEVAETNMDATLFFRSQGFLAKKLLRNYFEETREDAYLFEYKVENEKT